MSDTLSALRTEVEAKLAQADAELADLRGQRDKIGAVIRAKVIERDELRSAVAKLTPKKQALTGVVAAAETEVA